MTLLLILLCINCFALKLLYIEMNILLLLLDSIKKQ